MKTLFTKLFAPKTDGDEGGGAPLGDSLYGAGTPIPTREAADDKSNDNGADAGDGAGRDEAGATDDGDDETPDFTDPAQGDEGEGEGTGEDGDAGEGDDASGQKPVTKEPQFLRIAPEDLAALRANREAGEGDQPRLSEAEIAKLVNPVQITPELVAAIGHEDPTVRAKGLKQFADATVRNAVSLARIIIQQKEKEFEARLGPIAQQHQQVQVQQTRQSFYEANKDLVKYDIIVKAAAQEVEPLDAAGREKSQQQIFKEVALLTKKKLADLGIKIGQPNANHSAVGGKPVPGANRLSPSGRSGGDQHSGKGKPNNADADIYAR